jgi:hypothetical protein
VGRDTDGRACGGVPRRTRCALIARRRAPMDEARERARVALPAAPHDAPRVRDTDGRAGARVSGVRGAVRLFAASAASRGRGVSARAGTRTCRTRRPSAGAVAFPRRSTMRAGSRHGWMRRRRRSRRARRKLAVRRQTAEEAAEAAPAPVARRSSPRPRRPFPRRRMVPSGLAARMNPSAEEFSASTEELIVRRRSRGPSLWDERVAPSTPRVFAAQMHAPAPEFTDLRRVRRVSGAARSRVRRHAQLSSRTRHPQRAHVGLSAAPHEGTRVRDTDGRAGAGVLRERSVP